MIFFPATILKHSAENVILKLFLRVDNLSAGKIFGKIGPWWGLGTASKINSWTCFDGRTRVNQLLKTTKFWSKLLIQSKLINFCVNMRKYIWKRWTKPITLLKAASLIVVPAIRKGSMQSFAACLSIVSFFYIPNSRLSYFVERSALFCDSR